ncbi:MAG: hypothetical protein ACOYD6_05230 [Limnochordia bacterium]
MLFVVGLDSLSREEKLALAAHLKAINSRNVLHDGLIRSWTRAMAMSALATQYVLSLFQSRSPKDAAGMKELNGIMEHGSEKASILQAAVEQEYRRLQILSDVGLNKCLRMGMARIGGVESRADTATISEAIVKKAAKACKLPTDGPLEPLEEAVFAHCLEEKMAQLKEQVSRMTDAQLKEFEAILNTQIQSLSKAEQETMGATLGLEELSAKHLTNFLKQTSSIAIAQMIISGFGFGSYLFPTTLIKSVSLLLGVTFSFGVYTTATSALAFLLSGPFLLLASLMGFGFMYRKAGDSLNDELAKLLILVGRSAYLQSEQVS